MKITQGVDVMKKWKKGRKSLNVNEEYMSALRTKSYIEILTKAESLINNDNHCCYCLLEPSQEAIHSIVESALTPQLKTLMLNYFNVSAEASAVFSHLLRSINRIRSNRVDPNMCELSQLFNVVRDKCSSMLHCLNKTRKKTKLIRMAHTLAVLRIFPLNFFKAIRRIGDQVDSAARGCYILSRDFETTSLLVGRLRETVEGNEAMNGLWLRRRSDVDVVEELQKSGFGLTRQVAEVEEHVYLCLVSINRARAFVVNQFIMLPKSL